MATFKTRAQAVADDVRRRILAGEFPGGSQLRQDGLASDYDVSRIPVREALLALEAEGLVVFHAHRGAFVTELSLPHIREIFTLRSLLECFILRKAIPRASEESLNESERVLANYDRALNSGGEIDNWSDYNLEFHRSIYAPANQPETLALIMQLNQQADRYIRMQLLYSRKIEKAVAEHHELLALVRKGDIDAACALLKRHIDEAFESIASVLTIPHSQDEG
ncbi:GntR family transcriptional regulator [Carnimonas bestiolae]|uniref:GntR family transcriptional regulator n=1 Tax=Carnimonas bestiolae TaxID=3402172 RepID=UPI003EDB9B82